MQTTTIGENTDSFNSLGRVTITRENNERPKSNTFTTKRLQHIRQHSQSVSKLTSLYKSNSTQGLFSTITDRKESIQNLETSENVVSTKQDFLHEKAQEKRALQTLQLSLKTQINQAEKQARQIKNANSLAEDEIKDTDKALQIKEQKTKDVSRQVQD